MIVTCEQVNLYDNMIREYHRNESGIHYSTSKFRNVLNNTKNYNVFKKKKYRLYQVSLYSLMKQETAHCISPVTFNDSQSIALFRNKARARKCTRQTSRDSNALHSETYFTDCRLPFTVCTATTWQHQLQYFQPAFWEVRNLKLEVVKGYVQD